MKDPDPIVIVGGPHVIMPDEATITKPVHPALIAKRRRARESYVVSDGQVLNPDESDFRRPAVSPDEAKEIEASMHAKKGKR